MRRRPRAGGALWLALALLVVAPPASGWIPEPERAWETLAGANRAGNRTRTLEIDVALVGSDGAVAATGRARFEPDGRARLELRYADGVAELHERELGVYRAARNGAPIEKPLRLLPPLAPLQASSPIGVADAMRDFGAEPARVDLGMEGESDCWVLGGRDSGPFEANTQPSLWVDQSTQQPVRIDDGRAAQYGLGPEAVVGGARLPSWIEVRAPGWPRWRLELRKLAPAAASTP